MDTKDIITLLFTYNVFGAIIYFSICFGSSYGDNPNVKQRFFISILCGPFSLLCCLIYWIYEKLE